MQSLVAAELPVALQNDLVEIRATQVGEMTAGYFRLKKGLDLGDALKGLPGDACQCPHWGFMIEGTLLMRTPDGERTYGAGEAFYWGPGHVPVALEDCYYVDFSPSAELAAVFSHITGG